MVSPLVFVNLNLIQHCANTSNVCQSSGAEFLWNYFHGNKFVTRWNWVTGDFAFWMAESILYFRLGRVYCRKDFWGRDPFNQNSNRSDRENWSTSKGGPVFSKLFRLDPTDPLSFGPKFPEILVEWIAPWDCYWGQGKKSANEWFSTNRRPMLCPQDSGIARGKHCESLQTNAWRNVVSVSVKSSVFGRRITHFRRDFVRSRGGQCWCNEVSVWLMR